MNDNEIKQVKDTMNQVKEEAMEAEMAQQQAAAPPQPGSELGGAEMGGGEAEGPPPEEPQA